MRQAVCLKKITEDENEEGISALTIKNSSLSSTDGSRLTYFSALKTKY